MIDAVIASKGRGDAVCPQLLSVEFALVAQRIVFGSDEESEALRYQLKCEVAHIRKTLSRVRDLRLPDRQRAFAIFQF